MTAHPHTGEGVIYPVALIEIDGIKTHILLDTGAGSSYMSVKLIQAINKRPKETKTRRIKMMLGSTTTKIDSYTVTLSAISRDFKMNIELSKVQKPELMTIDNPNYAALVEKYSYLKGVKINDLDDRPQFLIHVVLGASQYATIKTATAQRVGKPGQPVVERTLLGCTIMSPGSEDVDHPILLSQSTSADYKQLCTLDVLGLADTLENDQLMVFEEFKEQLEQSPEGWYQTDLPWKENHAPLPTNETGSKRQLEHLIQKLQCNCQYKEYHDITQEQLQLGVIEIAPEKSSTRELYILHKGVNRKEIASTKLQKVYNASARESNHQPPLNDCLHHPPPLQNLLWNILVHSRFFLVILTGDLQKAFSQIRIKQEQRDALGFHWRHTSSCQTIVYQFTRALFGLTCSLFLLGGVPQQRLEKWEC